MKVTETTAHKDIIISCTLLVKPQKTIGVIIHNTKGKPKYCLCSGKLTLHNLVIANELRINTTYYDN